MTNEEFNKIICRLGLQTKEVAEDIARLGDLKPAPWAVSGMRTGQRPVTASAAVWARLRDEQHRARLSADADHTTLELAEALVERLRRERE